MFPVTKFANVAATSASGPQPRPSGRWALGVLALVASGAACTAERAPRSFVQPNAIKKADMVGAWYYVQTVLDAPPTSAAAFVGLSSDLLKIRFDVQEDTLFARRAYEQIAGSEDAHSQNPKGYLGQPLAAWRISKHFDIIRDYNSTTGEETNKIIESEERPWSQREFFRVDWSKNLVNNYAGLFFDGDTKVEPVSYWESDPGKAEAIHFERAADGDAEFAKGEASYFDLTNKLVLTPTERTLCFGSGASEQCFRVPACFLRYQLDDCADSVVKVRHAFSKISPKHDYEPRKWDGKQMELFGLWDIGLNRLSYNREYGVTNSGVSRHAARFNLWKKSFNERGEKIPYAQRELRTIPYYADTSAEAFPEDLFVEGQKVVDQWNAAVQVAVQDVTGTMPTAPVFVWCHSPVKLVADAKGPADPVACKSNLAPELDDTGQPRRDTQSNPILRARQGDPRRSRIFWVNQWQESGPLGYGPPLFDLETGETISGQAYIYGAALDSYTSRGRDLVMLVSGKLSPTDFIAGTNVKDWVSKNQQQGGLSPRTLTATEVKERARAMDFSWAKGLAPEAPLDLTSPLAYRDSFRARQNAVFQSGVFGRGQADLGQVRRDRARGSVLEAMMVTPDIVSSAAGGAAAASWSTLPDAQKLRVSPLRASLVDQALKQRKQRLNAMGFDFADFADDSVAQRALRLAREAGGRVPDSDAVWRSLRKDIFTAVTLHEMGHNVGLRHNFRGSYDALNYMPSYWDLRTAGSNATSKFGGIDPKTGQALGVPYTGQDCAAGRLRPRYVDCPGGALSVEEAVGGQTEYQYSTVMDYGATFNSDLMGLGHYDKAAMKFSYAGDGYVEVFTKAKATNQALLRLISLQFFSASYGYPSPLNLGSNSLQGIAYTTYPEIFQNGSRDIEARQDVPYANIGEMSAAAPLLVDKKAPDTALRPMVPYYFCGDEFVGNLTCQRFDAGADAYEQAHDLISRYENYYLLNNFKRDRYSFYTSAAYRQSILGRYLSPLREQMTWYTLFRTLFADIDPGSTLFESEVGWGSFSVAVTQGFDLLGRIIAEPEAGSFQLVTADASTGVPIDHYKHVNDQIPVEQRPDRISIGLLDGKYASTTWDFDSCGYYWADECQSRIGYFLDKVLALNVLTDSQAYFTGRDTSTDVRLYAIGYVQPFRKQIFEKFGALLSGDYLSLAPSVTSDGRVQKPSWTLNDPGVGRTKLVDPATGFTLQLYAGVYGLSGFPSTFDQSFVDSTQIFVVGNGESPVPDRDLLASPGVAGPQATFDPKELVSASPPGAKAWLVWSDRTRGKTYAARAFARVKHDGAATAYRADAGVRMLETIRTLDAQAQTACGPQGDDGACRAKTRAYDSFRENIDIMRSLHNAFGYAHYQTDAPFYY